mgnify:CR=1 FL=1
MGTVQLSQVRWRSQNSLLLEVHRPHISKVFLDSCYALDDGETFIIRGEAILLEPNSRVWLGEFTCVASWDTLDESNNSFTVVEGGLSRSVTLPTGPHDIESLRAAIEEGLNADAAEGMGTYTVTRVSTGTVGNTFRAYQVSVSAGAFAIPALHNRLRSICNFPGEENSSQTSSFVDVRRVHSIYLHSTFGNHNCVSPTGARTVLAKIPVSVGYGGLVQAQMSGSEHDYVEAGTHALNSVRISLHDAAGRPLDLKVLFSA